MTLRPAIAHQGGREAPGSLHQNTPLLLVSGATATMQRLVDNDMATLLVSGIAATVRRHSITEGLGHLLNPRSGNTMESLLSTGLPIAADNDCFQGLNRAQYLAMLRKLKPHRDRVLWVTAPDLVGNAARTFARWQLWYPSLRYLGLRTAYVAQDGSEDLPPPWDELDCLFIGGSTIWKEGPHAARLICEAKDREKWVHVGRVNTLRRWRLFSALDIDSFDGTSFSRFSNKYIPPMLEHIKYKQHGMLDMLLA
jgi:hypothetical protein